MSEHLARREAVARALVAHAWSADNKGLCACGWEPDEYGDCDVPEQWDEWTREFATHQADAVMSVPDPAGEDALRHAQNKFAQQVTVSNRYWDELQRLRAGVEALARIANENLCDGWADDLRALLREARDEPWQHEGHKPVQHRDRKPPWCNACGWTSPVPAIPAMRIKDVTP